MLITALYASVLLLGGCEKEQSNGEIGGPIKPGSLTGPTVVSAGDIPGEWPLTVPEGLLACERGRVTIEVEGIKYALNARARVAGFADIRRIQKKTEDRPTGLPTTNLLVAGLDTCG